MRKLLSFVVFLWMVCFVGSTSASAAMTKTYVPAAQAQAMGLTNGFIEYLPDGYATRNDWPILVYWHGAGAEGYDLSKLEYALPSRLNTGPSTGNLSLPAIVLAPQARRNWWDTPDMDSIVNYALSHYQGKYDPNRLYMTGLSMGGAACYNYLNFGAHASQVAAIVPICGADKLQGSAPANVVSANTGVWGFVAGDDGPPGGVDWHITQQSFIAIAAARGVSDDIMIGYPSGTTSSYTAHVGPDGKHFVWDFASTQAAPLEDYKYPNGTLYSPNQMWTLYPAAWGLGHNSWDRTYGNDRMYEWLFKQKLSGPAPTASAVGPASGGFETPFLAANAFAYNPTGSNWSFAGNSGIVRNGSPFINANAPEGVQAAFLQTNASNGMPTGSITQSINLAAGTYNISLKAARRASEMQQVNVSVGSTVVSTFTPASSNYQSVTSFPFTVAAGTQAIKIEGTATSGDVTTFVDDVKINILSGAGTGLTGQYYSDQNLTTLVNTHIDPVINFDWGTGSAMSSVGPDHFSIRWSGQVQALDTGTYTFTTTTDDGVRLWVNGALLLNYWTDQSAIPHSANIALTAGQKYNIKMEYYDNTAAASAKLSWTRPGGTSEIIPQTQLFPTFVSAPSLANASFETPATANFYYAPPSAGWTFTGTAGVQKVGVNFGSVAAPNGSQTGLMQNLGSMSQSVAFATTGSYTLTYQAAQRPTFNATNQSIKVSVGGVVIDTWTPPSSTSYTAHSFPLTVTNAGTQTLTIEGTVPTSTGDSTALIDSVTLTN